MWATDACEVVYCWIREQVAEAMGEVSGVLILAIGDKQPAELLSINAPIPSLFARQSLYSGL